MFCWIKEYKDKVCIEKTCNTCQLHENYIKQEDKE